jgi:hypothetical protein
VDIRYVDPQFNERASADQIQYPWKSAHVLAPLILGALLLIAFYFWEAYGTEFPMFPSRLKQTQAFNVYGQDPVGVGIRGLPVGFGILAGAVLCLCLLSAFRGKNRELMIVASVLMTAGMIDVLARLPEHC